MTKQSDIDDLLQFVESKVNIANVVWKTNHHNIFKDTLKSLIAENEELKNRLEVSSDHDGIK